jgi:hypothetical protein
VAIYRPPGGNSQSFNEFLYALDQILKDESNCILAINVLDDSTRSRLYRTTIEAGGIHLFNKIDCDGCTFLIRNGSNSPGSLLDQFITDANDITFKLYVILKRFSLNIGALF